MNKVTSMLKNPRGLTLIELLISIGIGSVVITMLMSIMSSTLLTKNMADHENRLLEESYFISEYVQNRVSELGVRSIENISPDNSADQTLQMNHEYDLRVNEEGVVYRNYDSAEAFILHYDSSEQSIHYGSAEFFDYENYVFTNPSETKINSESVTVDGETIIDYTCISQSNFKNTDETIPQDTVVKCSSAIIQVNITLNYRINDDPLFKPMRFETTIVF